MQEFFTADPSHLINFGKRLTKLGYDWNFESIETCLEEMHTELQENLVKTNELQGMDESNNQPALKKSLSKTIDKDDFYSMVAFLVSLTARDFSFLLRIGISKKDFNFNVMETWEKSQRNVIQQTMHKKCLETSIWTHTLSVFTIRVCLFSGFT